MSSTRGPTLKKKKKKKLPISQVATGRPQVPLLKLRAPPVWKDTDAQPLPAKTPQLRKFEHAR